MPELAIVVIDHRDNWDDIRERCERYLQAGIGMVWMVDSNTFTVSVRTDRMFAEKLSGEDTITGNGVLPDFSCKVSKLFALPGSPLNTANPESQ